MGNHQSTTAKPKTAFLYTPDFEGFDYGPGHPLKNLRLRLTYDLIRAYGLLNLPDARELRPQPASEEELELFHSPEYLQALKNAEKGHAYHDYFGFGLGTGDNPIFRGMYTWSVLSAGASLEAARLVESGGVDCAFNIAGGFHHAGPAQASGFCYVNDPALTIRYLISKGYRVAYVDIDAHHGDGVQAAFYDTDQVLTVSFHETGETLFPGTGFVEELGKGKGEGYSVNVPLYPGSDDEIFLWAFQEVAPPLIRAFQPDILVTQLGVDTHRTDPLSHLELTIQGFGRLVEALRALSSKWVALGGGGYNLANVPRAWALAWGIMNGLNLPDQLPPDYMAISLRWGVAEDRLFDDPFPSTTSPIKKRAMDYAREQVAKLRKMVFPRHGIRP